MPYPSMAKLTSRTNEFCEKLRKALVEEAEKAQAKAKAKAKGKAQAKAKSMLKPVGQLKSLAEAQANAQKCTKCTIKLSGLKGCTHCMGDFFEHVRQRR